MPRSINLRLFAMARQLAGTETLQVEVPEPATVAALRRALTASYPQFAPFERQLLFAINAQYATEDAAIPAEAEVACIPPVSGG